MQQWDPEAASATVEAQVATVITSSGLQVVSIPPPKYTDAARANKVQGNVLVIATFKADGTVGSPQVIRGLGYGLDEAALDVVKHVNSILRESTEDRLMSPEQCECHSYCLTVDRHVDKGRLLPSMRFRRRHINVRCRLNGL